MTKSDTHYKQWRWGTCIKHGWFSLAIHGTCQICHTNLDHSTHFDHTVNSTQLGFCQSWQYAHISVAYYMLDILYIQAERHSAIMNIHRTQEMELQMYSNDIWYIRAKWLSDDSLFSQDSSSINVASTDIMPQGHSRHWYGLRWINTPYSAPHAHKPSLFHLP